MGLDVRIIGVRPILWSYNIKDAFLGVLGLMAEILELDVAFDRDAIENVDRYVGEEGYGYCTPEGNAALRLMAQKEGILLEPIYTGKTLAGLLNMIERGEIGKDETVVMVHTGGTPALFAYTEELLVEK